jgi:hypothetical protein
MSPVSSTNALYGQEQKKRRVRVGARFVNNAMMATLLGAVISDGLEDGRVVSGVGGQYDFVAQAFALAGARSIIALNATREQGGKTVSNICWSYGHCTIPRHLRDIVVTEYGAADLRGKSDSDVIASMLAITDSRFQDALLRRAKDAGKIPKAYDIPSLYRENTPERIGAALSPLHRQGWLPDFPFGTDFTETEQRLMLALGRIKRASKWRLLNLAGLGLAAGKPSVADGECLERMELGQPKTVRERLYRALLLGALTSPRDAE